MNRFVSDALVVLVLALAVVLGCWIGHRKADQKALNAYKAGVEAGLERGRWALAVWDTLETVRDRYPGAEIVTTEVKGGLLIEVRSPDSPVYFVEKNKE